MAHNEENDHDEDDDQHVHIEQPNIPSNASSSPSYLITLNQEGSLGDGHQHIMRYISHCFM